jgi:hypothetical protein
VGEAGTNANAEFIRNRRPDRLPSVVFGPATLVYLAMKVFYIHTPQVI